MFSREQHERPCNNYRSTGIRIPLLSVTTPIDGNVGRTGIGLRNDMGLEYGMRIWRTESH